MRNRGFTIFELLVVMAIIAIIALLMLARIRAGQAPYEVAQAAQRFASDIRQAQGMAISGAETAGQGGGYGVRGDFGSYNLFLNNANNGDGCPIGSETTVKTIELASGVFVTPNDEVFFAPPDAKTCINGNKNREETQFQFSKGSSQKTVIVTKYGKVEVQ